jgi:hypothetical protein
MSTHRRISLHVDLRTTCLKKPAIIDKYPARRFPIQGEIQRLALQLLFLQVSESMGNHDSKIVDAASVD